MDQKSSFFICPRVSARFLHCFCTPAGKPCFSLHCLHSVHRGGTCRGEAPPSCWRKTVLLLKSPTGAFIAALRSQTRIFHTFSGKQQAGELRVLRISARLFFPLPLNTAGGVPPCRDPAAEGPVQFEAAAAAGAVQCFAHKIQARTALKLKMCMPEFHNSA